MLSIDYNQNITAIQGDSGSFNITLMNLNGEQYIPKQDDSLEFLIMNNKNVMLSKSIPVDSMMITMTTSDTLNLNPGQYQYYINRTDSEGYETCLASGDFILNADTRVSITRNVMSSILTVSNDATVESITGTISSSGHINGSLNSSPQVVGSLNMAAGQPVDVSRIHNKDDK